MKINKEKLKNIAFMAWLFPKLSETFILNQIVQLKKLRYSISIFAVKDPRKGLAKEDFELEKEVHEDIKKYRLLNLTKYGSPGKISSLLKKEIKKKKIDIVYFQFSDLAAEILKYGEIKCPTISVFHDISKPCSKKEFSNLKGKYKNVFKKITIILATSEFTKNELIKLGCKKHKILVHHMGVDTNIFKASRLELPIHHLNFIMIGRFVEKKGFIYGIRAFKKTLEKNPNHKLKLLIIGDGILHEVLQREVSRLKLENEINFLGKLSQKNVAKFLRRAHYFLCPSITTRDGKREGSPTVVMEAAACDIPIIATKHAGIPEILKNNCGILVREKSIIELSQAMSRIVRNYQGYKKRFCNKARRLIDQEYNVKIQVRHLLNIFNLAFEIKKQEDDKYY